jgi:hypothetical protein
VVVLGEHKVGIPVGYLGIVGDEPEEEDVAVRREEDARRTAGDS